MTTGRELFRVEALAAQRNRGLGEIVLVQSASATLAATVLGALALALVTFVVVGRYTAHQTLRGHVVPEGSVIEITAPQAGVLIDKRVTEGQLVAEGEELFVVSSERQSRSSGAIHASASAQLRLTRASLERQIEVTRSLAAAERTGLEERRAALARENATLDSAHAAQRERLTFAVATVERYTRLRAQGYVAEEAWAEKQSALLEQRARLTALERERAAGARLAAELESRATMLDLQYGNDVAALERAIAATDLELAANEAERASLVVAPRAGVIGASIVERGQTVERGAALAALVPADARLQVELLAPSRAVGFITAGEEVRLRYAAFPYQKFGHARGTVTSVSATALAAIPGSSAGTASREPLYLVTVALDTQTVEIYGEQRQLRPAMAVEADVLLETRRLYEWLFEPLLALARRTNE